MMGTRDAVNDWLEKRREKARAEGIALGEARGITLGEAKGRAKLVSEIVAWNERRLAAEAKGEPFDEPPPGADGL